MMMITSPSLFASFIICVSALYFTVFVEGVEKELVDLEPVLRSDRKLHRNTVQGYRKVGAEVFQAQGYLKVKRSKRSRRAAVASKARLWKNAKGRPLVPYVIEPSNYYARRVILRAMRHWTKHVPCLRFVRRTNQRSYLSFYEGDGCFSDVGRIGGRQRLSIGRGCAHVRVIIHEIGHALGFWHEQSRPDRDRYVKIYWENITPEYKYAFDKFSDGRINSLGVSYDYDSIMHYRSTAFGQGRTTITRINGDKRLSNSRGLSASDIKQARLLYCRSGGTRRKRLRRPATIPYTGCSFRDYRSMCGYWAKQGYCSSTSANYSRMYQNCKKTCFCKYQRTGVCRDKNTKCIYWSRSGYCTSYDYANYMQEYCRKSCRKCT